MPQRYSISHYCLTLKLHIGRTSPCATFLAVAASRRLAESSEKKDNEKFIKLYSVISSIFLRQAYRASWCGNLIGANIKLDVFENLFLVINLIIFFSQVKVWQV